MNSNLVKMVLSRALRDEYGNWCEIIETGNQSYRLQQQQNFNLKGEDKF